MEGIFSECKFAAGNEGVKLRLVSYLGFSLAGPHKPSSCRAFQTALRTAIGRQECVLR